MTILFSIGPRVTLSDSRYHAPVLSDPSRSVRTGPPHSGPGFVSLGRSDRPA